MTREEEIILVLKDLLRNTDDSIDNNYMAHADTKDAIKSCEKIIEISKEIGMYLNELERLIELSQ